MSKPEFDNVMASSRIKEFDLLRCDRNMNGDGFECYIRNGLDYVTTVHLPKKPPFVVIETCTDTELLAILEKFLNIILQGISLKIFSICFFEPSNLKPILTATIHNPLNQTYFLQVFMRIFPSLTKINIKRIFLLTSKLNFGIMDVMYIVVNNVKNYFEF